MLFVSHLLNEAHTSSVVIETDYYVPLTVKLLGDALHRHVEWYWDLRDAADNLVELAFTQDNVLRRMTCVSLTGCPPCAALDTPDAPELGTSIVVVAPPLLVEPPRSGALRRLNERSVIRCSMHGSSLCVAWSDLPAGRAVMIGGRVRIVLASSGELIGLEIEHLSPRESATLRDYFARHSTRY